MLFYLTVAVVLVLVVLWIAYRLIDDDDPVFIIVAEGIMGLMVGFMVMLIYCGIVTAALTGANTTETATYKLLPLDGERGALVRIDMTTDDSRGKVQYTVDSNGDREDRSRPARLVNIVDDNGEPTVTVTSHAAIYPLWWPFGSTNHFDDTYTLTVPADTVTVETD